MLRMLKKQKVVLKSLQIHATHLCNLSCSSCNAFSQFKIKGSLDTDTLSTWLKKWEPRVHIEKICLLGGEPTLNPELIDLIRTVYQFFPKKSTQKVLFTNGFYLKNHSGLEKVLRDCHFELRLTVHSDEPHYLSRILPIIEECKRWEGVSFLVYNGSGKNIDGIEFREEKWTKRYHETEGKVFPFEDKNPRSSWEKCPSKFSMQLHDGRIWKCPMITYLRLLKPEVRQDPAWEPYMKYQGIDPDCTDKELLEFSLRADEEICGMCPSNRIDFSKGSPLPKRTKMSSYEG